MSVVINIIAQQIILMNTVVEQFKQLKNEVFLLTDILLSVM